MAKTIHVPGIGNVKSAYLYIGGGVFGLGVMYVYVKKRKAATAAANAAAATVATAATQNQGDGSIDPTTGVPYADEGGVYGYGGIDPETGIPYEYENTDEEAYEEYGSQTQFSNNEDWATAAISDAQSDLNATQALAQQSVSDYLLQSPGGLPASEYDLMQELLGLIGPPPDGSFTLHESTSTSTGTGSGNKPLTPGQVLQIPVAVQGNKTMASVAAQFGISLQHLLDNNPGTTASTTGRDVNVPYLVKSGNTVQSIATEFQISVEHLEEILEGQGIV